MANYFQTAALKSGHPAHITHCRLRKPHTDMVQQRRRCHIEIDHWHHFSIRAFSSNNLL